jgi:hypothetical protein
VQNLGGFLVGLRAVKLPSLNYSRRYLKRGSLLLYTV